MVNEQLFNELLVLLPKIIFSICIFIAFWLCGMVFKILVMRMMNKKHSHANISSVLAGIVKNIMLILGLITALGTLGVNISAIVAGLGLTGFAFGFAFKDMLSNFISGILIFIYEPFKLGDVIEVEGKTGKVIDINLRYVTMVSEEQRVLIPNSISVSKVISVKA
jgi:small-conductance mechanosensitive channel